MNHKYQMPFGTLYIPSQETDMPTSNRTIYKQHIEKVIREESELDPGMRSPDYYLAKEVNVDALSDEQVLEDIQWLNLI